MKTIKRRKPFHVAPEDAGLVHDPNSTAGEDGTTFIEKHLSLREYDAAEYWLHRNDPRYNVPELDEDGNEIPKSRSSDAWHGSIPKGIATVKRGRKKVGLLTTVLAAGGEPDAPSVFDILLEQDEEAEEEQQLDEALATHARLGWLAARGALPHPDDMTDFERRVFEGHKEITFAGFGLRKCANPECRIHLWTFSDAATGTPRKFCSTRCRQRAAYVARRDSTKPRSPSRI